MRMKYFEKERKQEEKRERLEKEKKYQLELNKEKSRQHDEYIKSVIENNKALQQMKVDDYNNKQKQLLERQNQLNEIKKNKSLIEKRKY